MTEQSYSGAARFDTANSEWNRMDFAVRQILGKSATCTLVRIAAVHAAGEVAAVGLLDVQPLVGQIDGRGDITPHGIIHNVPYMRMQGGTSAVILDPVVGDLGICVFAAHDISTVKATRAAAGPGSRRRFDWADALYIGGILNGVPEQYVRFSASGVEISSPTLVRIVAPTVEIAANVTISGTTTGTGLGVFAGKSVSMHTHGNVASGSAHSGPPD